MPTYTGLIKSKLTKTQTKPSKLIRNQAKKLKIKLTVKRNGKRVYKSEKALKTQIKSKLKN